ncbi:MAG: hypothetical protein ACLURV_03955 [Gallintestinimicrobium sp.]
MYSARGEGIIHLGATSCYGDNTDIIIMAKARAGSQKLLNVVASWQIAEAEGPADTGIYHFSPRSLRQSVNALCGCRSLHGSVRLD